MNSPVKERLHSVLRRQLKKCGASLDRPPTAAEWQSFVKRVNHTYLQAEQDRYLLERSLDISSREMQELYEKLKETSANELAAAHQRLKDINERLKSAHDEAIHASEAKSAFLANMSHELRTPLNAIIGYSEMLVEDYEVMDSKETVEDLKKLRASANHLLSLLNNILDLSKIEAGKFELFINTFKVFEELEDMMIVINPILDKNDNQFTIDICEDLGEMRSDPLRLRQVLINLLANASKFTKQGHITLKVEHKDEDYLSFSVSDTGIGISEERLEQLFSPFVQEKSSTSSQYGGTGLGLTISKHFCELMGGTLSATSVEGSGSTFTVVLPKQLPVAPAV